MHPWSSERCVELHTSWFSISWHSFLLLKISFSQNEFFILWHSSLWLLSSIRFDLLDCTIVMISGTNVIDEMLHEFHYSWMLMNSLRLTTNISIDISLSSFCCVKQVIFEYFFSLDFWGILRFYAPPQDLTSYAPQNYSGIQIYKTWPGWRTTVNWHNTHHSICWFYMACSFLQFIHCLLLEATVTLTSAIFNSFFSDVFFTPSDRFH